MADVLPGTGDGHAVHARTVALDDVELHVLEAGAGRPVILAHGFPELAFSWRHQLGALAAAGYHAVAPDQRGYGGSSRPEAIEDYDILHLTGDLLALLDRLGEEQAVFVGHDWGAMVVWALAQLAPERVAGVVGMSVPFTRRGRKSPTELMRRRHGESFFYMLYFQEPGVADADLGRDAATTMRRLLVSPTTPTMTTGDGDVTDPGPADRRGFVDRIPEPAVRPDWLEAGALEHYVEVFTRTGFTGGINWYRNLDRNWALTGHLAGAGVDVPSLFIGGSLDGVLRLAPPSIMDGWLHDHRGTVLVEGAGHWVQQEAPGPVNDALLAFLTDICW